MEHKISAQELMDVMIATQNAAIATNKSVIENNKAIANLSRKMASTQGDDTTKKPKEVSKGATILAMLLVAIGAILMVVRFVPQVTSLLPLELSTKAWSLAFVAYAMISLLVGMFARVKVGVRICSVLFAVAPIIATLLAMSF